MSHPIGRGVTGSYRHTKALPVRPSGELVLTDGGLIAPGLVTSDSLVDEAVSAGKLKSILVPVVVSGLETTASVPLPAGFAGIVGLVSVSKTDRAAFPIRVREFMSFDTLGLGIGIEVAVAPGPHESVTGVVRCLLS